MVSEGRNGHLLPSGNAGAFAAAILRYHEHPKQVAAASRVAREHTAARFAWPVVADRLVSLLHDARPLPGARRRS